MDWITCPSCEEEFRVIADAQLTPLFCPFCAEDLPEELDDELEDE